MIKYLNLPTFLISAFLFRLLITGASIGDSIVIIALSVLYGGYIYLQQNKEPPANKELKDRLVELEESQKIMKDKLNSINFGSHLKR